MADIRKYPYKLYRAGEFFVLCRTKRECTLILPKRYPWKIRPVSYTNLQNKFSVTGANDILKIFGDDWISYNKTLRFPKKASVDILPVSQFKDRY